MKRIIWLFVLFQCVSGYARAQSGTGAISGTAQDGSGAVLPGVNVTLINPGTVGGNQTAVTDDRGGYQFTRLVLRVVEKSSGRDVTVYNLNPALRGKFDTLWDNVPEMDANYNGVEVAARKRLSNNWMMIGGITYGRNTGDVYGSAADLNNPNYTFRRGVLLAQDIPLTLKASGTYQLPYAISLSGSAQHYSGFAEMDPFLSAGTP